MVHGERCGQDSRSAHALDHAQGSATDGAHLALSLNTAGESVHDVHVLADAAHVEEVWAGDRRRGHA